MFERPDFGTHPPCLVGPLLGATLAAVVYKLLFSTHKPYKPNANQGFTIAAYFEPKSYINYE